MWVFVHMTVPAASDRACVYFCLHMSCKGLCFFCTFGCELVTVCRQVLVFECMHACKLQIYVLMEASMAMIVCSGQHRASCKAIYVYEQDESIIATEQPVL